MCGVATFICPLAPGPACVRVGYGEGLPAVEPFEMGSESIRVLSVFKPTVGDWWHVSGSEFMVEEAADMAVSECHGIEIPAMGHEKSLKS